MQYLSDDFYKVYRYVMICKQNELRYNAKYHYELLWHNEMSENEREIIERVTPNYFKIQLENYWYMINLYE